MTQLTIFEEPISTAKTEGKINVVSLFSGCGGMDLGFAQAGFRILENKEGREVILSLDSTQTHLLNDETRAISVFDPGDRLNGITV
jgi:C-5 cytosine-specific DNA methylase